MRFLAAYIMRGRMQAMMVAVATAILSLLITPLSYLSAAVIALVILRQGWKEGLWVIAGASLAIGLFSMLISLDPRLALGFVALIWLPIASLAMVLRATVSLPMTLTVVAGMGAMAVLATHGVLGDPAQWWRDILHRVGEEMRDQAGAEGFKLLLPTLESFAPHVVGWFVASAVLSLVMSLFLARWWQAVLYNPGGFRREFHALRLGRSMSWLVLASGMIGLLGSEVIGTLATDILIVLLMVYVIHGTGLVHGLVAARKIHAGWLVVMYVVAFFIFPPLTVLIAAAGVADSWLDFRGRFAGPTDQTGVK